MIARKEKYFIFIAFFIMVWIFSYRIRISIYQPYGYANGYGNIDVFSDTLVTGPIYMEHYGIPRNSWSSLGRFFGILGEMASYETFLTDSNWDNGYHRKKPVILVKNIDFTRSLFMSGRTVEFINGESFLIDFVSEQGAYIHVGLSYSGDEPLSEKRNGSLWDLRVKDENENYLPMGTFWLYYSHFGLQGKFFRHVAKLLPGRNAGSVESKINFFHFSLGVVTALTFIFICFFIFKKFDMLFAIVFYIVFLTSPWTINFAQNLYWLEFSLFLPMLCGVICSYKKDNQKICIGCYICSCCLLLLKSLCGYEYLSTIIFSLISFCLMDFVFAIIKKDKTTARRSFVNVVALTIFAVMGVAMALIIHSYFLGNHDVLSGLKGQFYNFIRRANGFKDLSQFPAGREFEGIFASRWDAFVLYFKWTTEIITGVPGNLFLYLCLCPIIIFIYNAKKNQLDLPVLILYIITFFASTSWSVLMKDHAYVHYHLNFILWYFGFIQVCFYAIVKQCYSLLRKILNLNSNFSSVC